MRAREKKTGLSVFSPKALSLLPESIPNDIKEATARNKRLPLRKSKQEANKTCRPPLKTKKTLPLAKREGTASVAQR